MINNLPTIYEVVTGSTKKQTKEKTPNSSNKNNKSSSKTSRHPETQTKSTKMSSAKEEEESGEEDEEEEDEDEHGNTLCGACGDNYAHDEFWICCDVCEKWFHGKCVKITPARAEHIKQYKCPACSNKRARA